MKKRQQMRRGAAWAALFLLAAGCASPADSPADKKDLPAPPGLKKRGEITGEMVRKVDTSKVEFNQIGNTRLTAGTAGVIGVEMFNFGDRDVEVPEWYMLDNHNFTVHYRRVPDGVSGEKIPWRKVEPKIPAKSRRVPLILKPRTRARFLVETPFVGELDPGQKEAFEVYVATNLRTVHMKTPTFLVTTE